ncbi:hypothetical protein RRG08_022501 [Elysia crispata]|uniref:Uncharacterized protein n=1 Tax=Elysia crispata TaxID=231223 RepID=A0AAE0Z3C0_9GAST|nr:hypothetical protein RRG08_022501 [Elysia crispata]
MVVGVYPKSSEGETDSEAENPWLWDCVLSIEVEVYSEMCNKREIPPLLGACWYTEIPDAEANLGSMGAEHHFPIESLYTDLQSIWVTARFVRKR